MKKALVVLGVWFILGSGTAYAGEFKEGAAKVGSVTKTILVSVDKSAHWLWDVCHNRILHPVVQVLTFGTVDLSQPS